MNNYFSTWTCFEEALFLVNTYLVLTRRGKSNLLSKILSIDEDVFFQFSSLGSSINHVDIVGEGGGGFLRVHIAT